MEHTALIRPAALRTLSRPEPPLDLHDRVMAAIHAEAARQQRRCHLRRCVAGGLAIAVSLVVIVHGGGLRKEQ